MEAVKFGATANRTKDNQQIVQKMDPSTFGSPAGGKEIEVLVKSLKKMKEKDTNSNFLSSGRCLPEVQTMFCRIGLKNLKF